MQTFAYFAFALMITRLPMSSAETGVDVMGLVSKDQWTCLKNNGFSFATVFLSKASQGRGMSIDTDAANTINNARAAGISKIDGAINFCGVCSNWKDGIQAVVQNLKKNNISLQRVWIVAIDSKVYGRPFTPNVNVIRSAINELKAQNYSVGIFTDLGHWRTITNNNPSLNDVPLWYAPRQDYDQTYDPNFTDFRPFGGWTKPAMKQTGGVEDCNLSSLKYSNQDWRP